MIFTESELRGAFLVDLERRADERGFFARAWCQQEFAAQGLSVTIAQINVSFSRASGTLRGLHYQEAPHAEVKLVRCTRGAIYDVIIDVRADSPSYMQWMGVTLSEANHRMLYVPEGFAHGFITLVPESEVTYLVSHAYAPNAERGIRYNDPALTIRWPVEVEVISEKDRGWPDFRQHAGARVA